MKKHLFLAAALSITVMAGAQITVDTALVPQYMQGVNGTNNNRTPFWYYASISGLTPGATYSFYTTMDTANASPTSNGAGNPYLINSYTGVIRRTTSVSLSNYNGHDTLVADNNGSFSGWFGCEATGNGRFTPGNTVYPKIIFNDGAGGTSVATRLFFLSYPVKVINYGTTASDTTQGSALYDSLDAQPKNFICTYDNMMANGRPLSISIVENDSLDIYPVTSIANFYRTNVDTLAGHWGAIIPNDLPNGVRALEERSFTSGMPIDTMMDADGIWCYGTNTVNMTNGGNAMYLNSTFMLSDSAMIVDSTWTGIPNTFSATSNSPNSMYYWDFGDGNLDTGAVVSDTYVSPGVYSAQVIITTGGCSDTITQTVVVDLSTGIFTPMPLSLRLAPNPTDGDIYILTRDDHDKVITVINVLGQTVEEQQLNGKKVHINIAGNEPGIYLIRVQDKVTGKSGVKKIVLQ